MLDAWTDRLPQDQTQGVIKLAILAVGGQGGGVLSDWIVGAAERSGYIAQSTSVAGVAQRTGATIYYIEMAPDTGRLPVFALSPSPGDVDILIAAELMEAGRAIMRGFVTPERTTLIASSHRIAAVSEKIEPGDGRASSEKVREMAEIASKRFLAFDMERIAVAAGTMISASLYGALAGSGVLPFDRRAFEETIAASGRGVKASLKAFDAAFERAGGLQASFALPLTALPGTSPRNDGERTAVSALPLTSAAGEDAGATGQALFSPSLRGEDGGSQMRGGAVLAGAAPVTPGRPSDRAAENSPVSSATAQDVQPSGPARPTGPDRLLSAWVKLAGRVEAMPVQVREMALPGLRKVVDYQDIAYGSEYLDLVDRAVSVDRADKQYALSVAAAKHVANALCYDDIIRVADLKTRSRRDARVRSEVNPSEGSILQVTEYFHPRVEELCGTLPTGLGRYIEARPRLSAFIDRRINKGRRVRTDSAAGFATLWFLGGLRRFRRRLLRHSVEAEHRGRWYRLALDHVARDYDLAVEILNCRRLIKGYSDTHVRGHSKFDRVLSALPLLAGRPDAADWLRRLREAALKDEQGTMLDGALKTVATLGDGPGRTVH